MSSVISKTLAEIHEAENELIAQIILRLKHNEVDPVLKVLYRWGKQPIRDLLDQINGKAD